MKHGLMLTSPPASSRRTHLSHATEVNPPFDDGSGYRVLIGDLEFVGVSDRDLHNLRSRLMPLGMASDIYEQFIESLLHALAEDQVGEADLRLQGSSVHLFSGWHKLMMYQPADLLEEFRNKWRRTPDRFELSRAKRLISRQWPYGSPRPARRLFDVMHKLGVHPKPSDYDVQLSCDELVGRAAAHLQLIEPELIALGPHINHPEYNFVRNDLISAVCPALTQWRLVQSDIVRRPVSIAVFGSSGPLDDGSRKSSHFKRTDWILYQGISETND